MQHLSKRHAAWLLAIALCGSACGDSGSATNEDSSSSGDSTSTGGDATPIVLVHGAWMGAWAWDEVAPLLEARGHATHVVELPAHGDDPTAATEASLAGYRDTVVAVLDGLDEPAAVVGHSMGGMVISEVAQARPQAISELVYVAALLPQSGQSLLDLAMTDPDAITAMHLVDNGDGTASIDPAAIGAVFCGDCDDAHVQTIVERTKPEPFMPLVTPAMLDDAAFGSVRSTYVYTEMDVAVSFAAQQAMVAATPVDDTRSLATAHSPFFSQPQALSDAIVELVE
ncbi:MAG TPA: alpha/beta fold hydrolase [Nannocystaceae bacterium]|nr:alpha/beta fold hydrolase [Nannocystaceae bacterium]